MLKESEIVIAIQIWLDLTRFRIDISLSICFLLMDCYIFFARFFEMRMFILLIIYRHWQFFNIGFSVKKKIEYVSVLLGSSFVGLTSVNKIIQSYAWLFCFGINPFLLAMETEMIKLSTIKLVTFSPKTWRYIFGTNIHVYIWKVSFILIQK